MDSLGKNSTKESWDSGSRTSSSGSLDKTDNVTAHQSTNNTNHLPPSPTSYGVNNGGVRLVVLLFFEIASGNTKLVIHNIIDKIIRKIVRRSSAIVIMYCFHRD